MPDMMPTKFDFDTKTGLSKIAKPINRPLSSLKGYFYDTKSFDSILASSDPLVYEYFDMGVPETSGNVAYGTTSIKPGKIGDEYFMTKGHFHTVLDTAEVYYCLSGHGGMMMETPEGKVEWREMRQGDVVYVPGRWAHRSINISLSEPFVMFFAFPGHAGHDYGTIASKGFRKLMVERDGKHVMIDNPRWNG